MQSFKQKTVLRYMLLLALGGCSSYSESFDCPIGEGLKCASLSEVNQKIDDQAINLSFPGKSSASICKGCKKVYWRDDLEEIYPLKDLNIPNQKKGF